MRLCYTALATSCWRPGLAVAQDVDQNSKTKVKVDDGKSTTVTGCIERNADGGFMLTNVAGKDGARGDYLLASSDDNDLDDIHKHVGERVEITGKAADQGKGKLKVETKAEGTGGKTESKSEVSGDLKGLPYLGVKSVRVLACVCP